MNLANERVMVTGGAGFLGEYVVKRLKARGCKEISIPRSQTCDLRDPRQVEAYFKKQRPTVVLNLAASCAGIAANAAHPSIFFRDNMLIGLNVIHYARETDVKKIVQVGTVCSYPAFADTPFRETDLWKGYPEETNAPYGVAKRALWTMLDAYHRQFRWPAAYLLMANLYGPGDHFSLAASHVIPALVRKTVDAKRAKEGSVEVWGDGRPTREFLYVDDAAEAVLMAAEKLNDPQPMNIGTGESISIRDLVAMIFRLANYDGDVAWKVRLPNGQLDRQLDIRRATAMGFKPKVSLEEGLKATIKYYEDEYLF